MSKTVFSFTQRLRIYMRDGFTCRYCGRGFNPLSPELSLDHRDPDGDNSDGNLVTACRHCNSSKGRRTPLEWSQLRAVAAPPTFSAPRILGGVAKEWHMTVDELRSRKRTARLVRARAEAAYRLRRQGATLADIAALLGYKDHSTVVHLLARYEQEVRRQNVTNEDTGEAAGSE